MAPSQPDPSIVNNCRSLSGMRRFSHEAMATTYEILILHENMKYAGQAARAAFNELDRLEQMFSRFIENSDISQINFHAADQLVYVGPETFECLQIAVQMYDQTNGAFDITIGPLLNCWHNKNTYMPSQEELDFAAARTGMHLLQLDETEQAVRLLTQGTQIDLGGIGKGYAVNRMARLLREWSIDAALIHGGYSSVLALDGPADTKGWPVTLSNPRNHHDILAYLHLRNQTLSSSGLKKGLHIIDPRTARPVSGKIAAWSLPPATELAPIDGAQADALSTAFMVMSLDEIDRYCSSDFGQGLRAIVILDEQDTQTYSNKVLRFGPWPESNLKPQNNTNHKE